MKGKDKNIYFVLNRVNPEVGELIRQKLNNPENIIAEISEEPAILSAGLSGTPITTDSQAVRDIVQRVAS